MIPAWLGTEAPAGFRATVALAGLKARTASPLARRRQRAQAVAFVVSMAAAALSGTWVHDAAASGESDPVLAALRTVGVDGLGGAGTAALATVLAAMLFAPVTGAATHAQLPDVDLAGVRPPRLYRYVDGVWNTVVSPVGASQLLVLTTLASLLTADGRGRVAAVALTWVAWVATLPVVALTGWGVELVRRRWSPLVRWWAAGAAGLLLHGVAAAGRATGRSLFGLGDGYAWVVAQAAAGSYGPVVLTGAGLVVGAAAVVVAGMAVARRALVLPAPAERTRQSVRPVAVPGSPAAALTVMILTTVWRSREVCRPILMMLLAAMPLLLAGVSYSGADATSMLASVVMVMPLSLAIGFGVNSLGLLGGAVTLLLSQPRSWRLLLRQLGLVQLAATMLLGGLVIAAPAVWGRVTWSAAAAYAVGLWVTAVVTTVASLRYSVHRPHRTRLTGRGDPLVPPMVGMEYIVRLMLTGSLLGMLAATVADHAPWWVGATIVILAAWWGRRGWRKVSRTWADPSVRAGVAAVVGAV